MEAVVQRIVDKVRKERLTRIRPIVRQGRVPGDNEAILRRCTNPSCKNAAIHFQEIPARSREFDSVKEYQDKHLSKLVGSVDPCSKCGGESSEFLASLYCEFRRGQRLDLQYVAIRDHVTDLVLVNNNGAFWPVPVEVGLESLENAITKSPKPEDCEKVSLEKGEKKNSKGDEQKRLQRVQEILVDFEEKREEDPLIFGPSQLPANILDAALKAYAKVPDAEVPLVVVANDAGGQEGLLLTTKQVYASEMVDRNAIPYSNFQEVEVRSSIIGGSGVYINDQKVLSLRGFLEDNADLLVVVLKRLAAVHDAPLKDKAPALSKSSPSGAKPARRDSENKAKPLRKKGRRPRRPTDSSTGAREARVISTRTTMSRVSQSQLKEKLEALVERKVPGDLVRIIDVPEQAIVAARRSYAKYNADEKAMAHIRTDLGEDCGQALVTEYAIFSNEMGGPRGYRFNEIASVEVGDDEYGTYLGINGKVFLSRGMLPKWFMPKLKDMLQELVELERGEDGPETATEDGGEEDDEGSGTRFQSRMRGRMRGRLGGSRRNGGRPPAPGSGGPPPGSGRNKVSRERPEREPVGERPGPRPPNRRESDRRRVRPSGPVGRNPRPTGQHPRTRRESETKLPRPNRRPTGDLNRPDGPKPRHGKSRPLPPPKRPDTRTNLQSPRRKNTGPLPPPRRTASRERRHTTGSLRPPRRPEGIEIGGVDFDVEVVEEANKLWRSGRREAALELVSDALLVNPMNPTVNYGHASLCASLGARDAALDSLLQAIRFGFADRDRVLRDPCWAELRGEADFKRLIRRIDMRARTGDAEHLANLKEGYIYLLTEHPDLLPMEVRVLFCEGCQKYSVDPAQPDYEFVWQCLEGFHLEAIAPLALEQVSCQYCQGYSVQIIGTIHAFDLGDGFSVHLIYWLDNGQARMRFIYEMDPEGTLSEQRTFATSTHLNFAELDAENESMMVRLTSPKPEIVECAVRDLGLLGNVAALDVLCSEFERLTELVDPEGWSRDPWILREFLETFVIIQSDSALDSIFAGIANILARHDYIDEALARALAESMLELGGAAVLNELVGYLYDNSVNASADVIGLLALACLEAGESIRDEAVVADSQHLAAEMGF